MHVLPDYKEWVVRNTLRKKSVTAWNVERDSRNKEIHKALMLLNLISHQSSKCKTCNVRKSVFVKEQTW